MAQPILVNVESTPYDRQMERIHPVLDVIPMETPQNISLSAVDQWIVHLRRLRYQYSKEWKTPAEVNATRTADCKAKAIALYQIMQLMGATNVKFVIGKHRAGDWFTHAWLEWATGSGNYVLDPTFNWRVIREDPRDTSKYLPLYAYEGMMRYRAINAPLLAERPLRAVAAGNLY